MDKFQKRIYHQGNLEPPLKKVCEDFNLGNYISHAIIPIGYEDFNLRLNTNKGSFFVKIFSKTRNKKECQRYSEIIEKALAAGINTPKLFRSNQGFLYQIEKDSLIVTEYIEGENFFENGAYLSDKEIMFLIKQTALINNINFKPEYIYDHWAIPNFLKEYKEKGNFLLPEDKNIVEPLVEIFNSIPFETLPYAFVHGDMIRTNLIKTSGGKIYVVDFSVSNWYPRIQELAVLFCDAFFNPNNTISFPAIYQKVISEYQEYIKLTETETQHLSNYVKLAHGMHVLLANYEKLINKNASEENEYFLNTGRTGLKYTSEIWNK